MPRLGSRLSRAAAADRRRATIDLVYDGYCGVCTRAAELLRRLDRHGRVRLHPSQGPGVLGAFGLTEQETAEAAWAFQPSNPETGLPGARYRGAAAVNRAADAILGVRLFVPVSRLPGMRRLQDRAYRWVAENRYRLRGTTPWCVQHPEACGAPPAAGASCGVGAG